MLDSAAQSLSSDCRSKEVSGKLGDTVVTALACFVAAYSDHLAILGAWHVLGDFLLLSNYQDCCGTAVSLILSRLRASSRPRG
jgi:hypothetical protein